MASIIAAVCLSVTGCAHDAGSAQPYARAVEAIENSRIASLRLGDGSNEFQPQSGRELTYRDSSIAFARSADELSNLDPPRDVVDEHREFISAVRALAANYEAIADASSDGSSRAQAESALDLTLADRWHRSCVALQEAIRALGTDVSLVCADE